jgi:hypothetical protein
VPESIRAFDDLLELWRPSDDPSVLLPPPDDLPFHNESPPDELPEDTFADWFLPGYRLPKDPLPEELWLEMVREANAGARDASCGGRRGE